MSKYDLSKLFPPPMARNHKPTHRTYDVRITLNKSGHGKPVVRFGFLNEAAKIFGENPFIEASDVEYIKDRIYFKTHVEKVNNNVHTLSSNGKSRADSCYFALTPSDKAEKIYRMNWIGKLFPLFWDEENELYYIDMREEN